MVVLPERKNLSISFDLYQIFTQSLLLYYVSLLQFAGMKHDYHQDNIQIQVNPPISN